MYKVFIGFIFCSFIATATVPISSELDAVLDSFHQTAGEANHEKYLGLLAEDAIFWVQTVLNAGIKANFQFL
ncbi:MAG: hypothetical protein ACJA2G_001347 [Cognaticolwellia sp.]|jgi:hypothetical protein